MRGTFENRFVPTRMAEGGVPTQDACLVRGSTGAPLALGLPPYAAARKTRKEQRDSLPFVLHMRLFPILPPMTLDPLAAEHTRDDWIGAMWSAGYRPCETSARDYASMIGGTAAGLFGREVNPLDAVARVCTDLGSADMLLHYLFVVALQYYLLVRRAWAVVRTDADAPFHERLPPYVFVLFKTRDWSSGAPDQAVPPLERDWSNLEVEAQRQPMPIFLRQVVAWVLANAACALPADLAVEADRFCDEKLRKNFVQSLVTLRFREWMPTNLVERMGAAAGAQTTYIKFFAHPKDCNMPSVSVSSSADTPQWFCHLFLAPDRPLVRSVAPTHALLWQTTLFYPITLFHHRLHKQANSLCGRLNVFPVNGREAAESGYNRVVCLSAVRARFAMFFKGDQAYAYVPNLYTPTLVPPANEMSPEHMSVQAWEWCIARGAACVKHEPLVREEGEEDYRLASQILTSEEWRDPWRLLVALRRVLGNEEHACAQLVQRMPQVTLDALRESYARWTHEAERRASSQQVQQLDAVWNRCTPLDVPPDGDRDTWFHLFPVSVIGFGGRAWIDAWHAPPPYQKARRALAQARAILARADVQRELKDAGADGVLDPSILEAVAILAPISVTDIEMTDASSSSSSSSSPVRVE